MRSKLSIQDSSSGRAVRIHPTPHQTDERAIDELVSGERLTQQTCQILNRLDRPSSQSSVIRE